MKLIGRYQYLELINPTFLQVRLTLPQAIGEVAYIGWGMTDLTPYIAFYQGAKIPAIYKTGIGKTADNFSAYWQLRKVQTLAMI